MEESRTVQHVALSPGVESASSADYRESLDAMHSKVRNAE